MDGIPCPNQVLKVQTYLISNQFAVTDHPDIIIENAGDIFYLFTVGIERKEHYRAVVSIASSDKGVVEAKMSNFSKFKCFLLVIIIYLDIKIMYIQVHLKFKTVM